MPSPWWSPDRHADRRPFLLARQTIKANVRALLIERGFVEVEPGCLQVSPGNEAHLHAFATELVGPDLSRRRLYLNTSPEFAMKKLMAAGESKIFSFTPCFRNRERGALHAPEFTMLEWYRAREPYEAVMEDALDILASAARTTGARLVSWKDSTCHPDADPERLSVAEAFSRHAGIDLLATIAAPGRHGGEGAHSQRQDPTSSQRGSITPDRDALAAATEAAGIAAREHDTWSDLFARVLAARIEPRLGLGRPTLLFGYPSPEAALARVTPGDPRIAERFELYVAGVELANGFGELTDADEQRANLDTQMALKERVYGERYPLDEDFLSALRRMPPAAGCALGFDRLVMLAAGATHIDQVQWTPLGDR